MAEAESKAAGFNSMVSMLRQLCATDRFAKLVEALPPETAELLRRPPLPVTWIPNRHTRAVLNAACKLAFDGNVRSIVDLSRRARMSDLGTLYKFFVRLSSVEFALSRAAKMYGTYTRNNGVLAV